MTDEREEPFKLGQTYSRMEISNVLGGSIQLYLPTRAGQVVCGCFIRSPDYNPQAPREVVFGKGPIVRRNAELAAQQSEPLPVFIFESSGAWEYVGLFRCTGLSTDAKLLRAMMAEYPERGEIAGVLYFEPIAGSAAPS